MSSTHAPADDADDGHSDGMCVAHRIWPIETFLINETRFGDHIDGCVTAQGQFHTNGKHVTHSCALCKARLITLLSHIANDPVTVLTSLATDRLYSSKLLPLDRITWDILSYRHND